MRELNQTNKMNKIIELQTKPGIALSKQKMIKMHAFPFSLNTNIGCLTACRYCYLQNAPFKWHTDFGNEIKVKTWIADKLDKELESKKNLPQHLKRVQVNSATEGYSPQGMHKVESQLGRDIMAELLEVFRKHWLSGNKWMVHLVTKSHLIQKHLPLIAGMKDQVQVELTITSLSETRARDLEGFASSVSKRLDIIHDFSAAGVFVRVMCMPFIGDRADAMVVRDKCISLGASGFKHKGMNYWDDDEMLKGNLVHQGGKHDTIFSDLLVRSGEPVFGVNGSTSTVSMGMPDKKWKNMANRDMTIIDSGYSACNSVNWGYIK